VLASGHIDGEIGLAGPPPRRRCGRCEVYSGAQPSLTRPALTMPPPRSGRPCMDILMPQAVHKRLIVHRLRADWLVSWSW
jgi:hypothetical protein